MADVAKNRTYGFTRDTVRRSHGFTKGTHIVLPGEGGREHAQKALTRSNPHEA